MKAFEYAEYQKRFAEFMQAEGLRNLSTLENAESYFSHSRCDVCKSLAGMRYDANGYIKAERKVSDVYSVCPDCVYYAEYGRLDDTTMLDMENDLTEISKA